MSKTTRIVLIAVGIGAAAFAVAFFLGHSTKSNASDTSGTSTGGAADQHPRDGPDAGRHATAPAATSAGGAAATSASRRATSAAAPAAPAAAAASSTTAATASGRHGRGVVHHPADTARCTHRAAH